MADLSDLTPSSDTIEVKIVHPKTKEPFNNDEGSQMVIELYAPHTKEYKSVFYKQASKRLKMQEGDDMDFEALEEASVDLLAGITKSWDIQIGGKKPKLNPSKAKEIYSEVFWLKSQLEGALNNFEVFTDA